MGLSEIRIGLTFDDVLLVPKRSSVRSRQDVSLRTRVSTNVTLDIPVLSANMDTVTESDMATAMSELGGIGIIHRFLGIDEQADQVGRCKKDGAQRVGAAVGVGAEADLLERAEALIEAGCDVLVLDIAHGHAEHAISGVSSLKQHYPGTDVLAGNVATAAGAHDLEQAGADAVKVGVGPGGVCTTRLVAGVGVPQLTAIDDVASSGISVPIIADGGIRTSGDMAKALAAGADSVMIGSLLAGTKESPGDVESTAQGLVKRYRGMASFEAVQRRAERTGEVVDDEYFEQRAAEGVEGTVPYKGEVGKVIGELMGGVKSSMSYLDARNLAQFRQNAQFIRVTPTGLRENHPHATL
ncbi:MAG: IMP dehydrogenase [Actinomycetota bacterium]